MATDVEIAAPFRVWKGDYPITEWFSEWSMENKSALQRALTREHMYSDWEDEEWLAEDRDPDKPQLVDEALYLRRAETELARTRKQKETTLEKKLKQYNKLKEELGL